MGRPQCLWLPGESLTAIAKFRSAFHKEEQAEAPNLKLKRQDRGAIQERRTTPEWRPRLLLLDRLIDETAVLSVVLEPFEIASGGSIGQRLRVGMINPAGLELLKSSCGIESIVS